MSWSVRVVPGHCENIAVALNGTHWTLWSKVNGNTDLQLPAALEHVSKVVIGMTVSPAGARGALDVIWKGRMVSRIETDDHSEQTVTKPLSDWVDPPGAAVHPSQPTDSDMSVTDAAAFLSPTLSLLSRNPETNPRTTIDLPVNGQIVAVAAESKTFRTWEILLPWVLRSTSRTALASLDNITVTVLRAVDPQTGGFVVEGTFAFRQSSLGWKTLVTEGPAALVVRIEFLDSRDGVLETWKVSTSHIVSCRDADLFFSFKVNLRPDWYDILAGAVIIIDPHTWRAC
jgi:hypothetical protein